MKSGIFLSVAIICTASFTRAQEVIGTITGTIDGVEKTWFLTEMDGMSQSDYSGGGSFLSVSLIGHATDNTVMNTQDALAVSWTDMAGSINGAEVRYLSEGGFATAYTAPDDQPVSIEITTIEETDAGLKLEGTVSGTLGWSAGIGQDPDMGDTVELDAVISGTIKPLQ